MEKTVPAQITDVVIPSAQMQAGRIVEFADMKNLSDGLHYLFSRKGCRVSGMVFYLPFETSSATYTQVNSNATNADMSLENWEGAFEFDRLIYGTSTAGPAYEITLNANMYNLDLRLTLERLDGARSDSVTTTTLSITNTNTTDSEAISGALEYAEAAVYQSGSTSNAKAKFRMYLEAKSKNGTTPGYLWNFAARETRIGATNLPRT